MNILSLLFSDSQPTKFSTNQFFNSPNIPTVFQKRPFFASREAESLHAAIGSTNYDHQAVVRVLSSLTYAQRVEVLQQYQEKFGNNVKNQIVSKFKGKIQDAFEYLFWPLEEIYAHQFREAVKGLGTNEDALIELTTTLTGDDLKSTASAYQSKYGKKLEKDVKDDTSGFFRELLVALLEGRRSDSLPYPAQLPRVTATTLNSFGEGKWEENKETIKEVFSKKSYAELRKMFEEYEKLTGRPIEEELEREFKRDARKLLLAIGNSTLKLQVFKTFI